MENITENKAKQNQWVSVKFTRNHLTVDHELSPGDCDDIFVSPWTMNLSLPIFSQTGTQAKALRIQLTFVNSLVIIVKLKTVVHIFTTIWFNFSWKPVFRGFHIIDSSSMA